MSVFPTKILLATDGSDESDLAATAAELAKAPIRNLTSSMSWKWNPGTSPRGSLSSTPNDTKISKKKAEGFAIGTWKRSRPVGAASRTLTWR